MRLRLNVSVTYRHRAEQWGLPVCQETTDIHSRHDKDDVKPRILSKPTVSALRMYLLKIVTHIVLGSRPLVIPVFAHNLVVFIVGFGLFQR